MRGEVEQQPYLVYRGQSGQVRGGCEQDKKVFSSGGGEGFGSLKPFSIFFFTMAIEEFKTCNVAIS